MSVNRILNSIASNGTGPQLCADHQLIVLSTAIHVLICRLVQVSGRTENGPVLRITYQLVSWFFVILRFVTFHRLRFWMFLAIVSIRQWQSKK